MASAPETSDDLAVRLNWPADPLAAEPIGDHSNDSDVDVEARLAALESTTGAEPVEDVGAAVEALAARVDHVTTEMVKVLRNLNNSLRRSRDQNIAALDERVAELRADIAALMEKTTSQRAMFGDDLAGELKTWRRRFPAKTPLGKVDEKAMEDLTTRLADEVEIRVVAALKKSGFVKKR